MHVRLFGRYATALLVGDVSSLMNFMDDVDEVCMDNFTSDQTTRMRTRRHAFRDKKTRQ